MKFSKKILFAKKIGKIAFLSMILWHFYIFF